MTLEQLKDSGHIIFEAISGSRAYGLATATSDTDIRGVYILPKAQFYGLHYIGQINNETNDIVYYELRKFIELLAKNNPNMMELLNMPEECILYQHPLFKTIKQEMFLSKLCKDTFANYAYTQIKKARGLNKKIVNPVEKERKGVLDFCYVRTEKQSLGLFDFLGQKGLSHSYCGLAKVNHVKDCFNLFYHERLGYKGIATAGANDVCLSSIPKTEQPIGLLYFNKDGYSSYCKKYAAYWSWVSKRNEARYQNNLAHGKNYDTKNMMHTFRLLHMAADIAAGKLIVKRPNRNYLLAVKHGQFTYDALVQKAGDLKEKLELLYHKADLPQRPNTGKINKLLVELRKQYYAEKT